jgi:hypothetical protein
MATEFQIVLEQNDLPDPKKVLYKVNSKFKNIATKTKERKYLQRPRFKPWHGHAGV